MGEVSRIRETRTSRSGRPPISTEDFKDRVDAHICENKRFTVDELHQVFPFVSQSVQEFPELGEQWALCWITLAVSNDSGSCKEDCEYSVVAVLDGDDDTVQLLCFWTLSIALFFFYLKQSSGVWILSPSSG
jgi:hypothetical protein